MMDIAWEALLAAGTVFFLGAISPGPSLIVVLRNTMLGGRKQGVACAVGHGIGFGIYAISAVFGLVILLDNNPQIFQILQYIGIVLLLFYGWKIVIASLFCYSTSVGQFTVFALSIFLIPLQAEFGWQRGDILEATFYLTLTQALMNPVMGRLIDLYGVRKVLIPFVCQ